MDTGFPLHKIRNWETLPYEGTFEGETFFDHHELGISRKVNEYKQEGIYDYCPRLDKYEILDPELDKVHLQESIARSVHFHYERTCGSRYTPREAIMKTAMYWRFEGKSDDDAIIAAERTASKPMFFGTRPAKVGEVQKSLFEKVTESVRRKKYPEFYERAYGFDTPSPEEQLKEQAERRAAGKPYPSLDEAGKITYGDVAARNAEQTRVNEHEEMSGETVSVAQGSKNATENSDVKKVLAKAEQISDTETYQQILEV